MATTFLTCCIIASAILGVGGLFGSLLEVKGISLTLVFPPLGLCQECVLYSGGVVKGSGIEGVRGTSLSTHHTHTHTPHTHTHLHSRWKNSQ